MMQFFSKIGVFFFSYFLFVPHDQNNIYYKMALEIKKKCDIYLEGLHFIITMIFFKGLTSMD